MNIQSGIARRMARAIALFCSAVTLPVSVVLDRDAGDVGGDFDQPRFFGETAASGSGCSIASQMSRAPAFCAV